MFFRKKQDVQEKRFDREKEIPVIKSSICTGEQVAGFKDKQTGHFREIMCIRSEKERSDFLEEYGIFPEEIKKEW